MLKVDKLAKSILATAEYKDALLALKRAEAERKAQVAADLKRWKHEQRVKAVDQRREEARRYKEAKRNKLKEEAELQRVADAIKGITGKGKTVVVEVTDKPKVKPKIKQARTRSATWGRPISPEVQAEILQLLQEGHSVKGIIRLRGGCSHHIQAIRNKAGLPVHTPWCAIRYPESFKQAVADCRNEGMTYARIERIFGINSGTVSKWAMLYKPCKVCGTLPE